ncbi:MAG: hypothetical protein J0J01_13080 [Reyranella sp.]|uniref:hypothetical protein n=1 Tax=Reyranella sp. TaxID=1929291 RepID=UPI001ACB8089|nr:hypothetical protein [Reyranella sp.]MBN9087837.1 hypothetical protein [Reyranella sp.]
MKYPDDLHFIARCAIEHIPFGWNQPNGICLLQQQRPCAHFRADGTVSGSICPEIALEQQIRMNYRDTDAGAEVRPWRA